MIPWMIAAGVLLVLVLLFVVGSRGKSFNEGFVSSKKSVEGFLTLDPPTALAQRQMLQLEGERRYNDVARLQSTLALLPDSQIEAALSQAVPAATNHAPSLLGLLGMKGHSGQDDGSNKGGAGVEQTGMVQSKINFCESITTVNCDMLNDPRMAECGFCHRDGTDSRGKGHRGGMYISADDQIRANEVSNSTGAPAQYKPTIGSCDPKNFTLMSANCQARELQLQCQAAGAPTSTNPCGQCYGSAASSATGLLYMGGKPLSYSAYLNVSHPGGHGGLTVAAGGQTYTLGPSTAAILDYTSLFLPGIQEGQQVQITLSGCPKVWAAWLSNRPSYDPADTGARVVSLDIGLQSMSPANAYEIAGDQNAQPVLEAVKPSGGVVQSPTTVMWFIRRDEIANPIVSSAWYGVQATGQGIDVTPNVRYLSAQGQNITILTQNLSIPNIPVSDPAYGTVKQLLINQDNGAVQSGVDGQTIDQSRTTSNVTFTVTVPATLADPHFADDLADCPNGPIVTTEIGAGLYGSHSCFKADGSFNPTQYCLQELFQSAGGSQQGSLWPGSDAAVASLMSAVGNALGKAPTAVALDDVTGWLNDQASIANYGVNSAGVDPGFDAYKSACQAMLGFVPLNPCQGPTAATGPHTPECLDYLYRTSGNASLDAVAVDPTTLPYAYCTQGGSIAPLNPDGSVNQPNVTLANQYGAMANIRAFYQGSYNQSRDPSDFFQQAAALAQCTGAQLEPPVTPPDACPPPASDEWQCMGPNEWQIPEVFQVSPGGYSLNQSDASATCAKYGAQVASSAQLNQAQQQGADWCSTGWVADSGTPMYPITTSTGTGCGNGQTGVMQYLPPSGQAAVNCYGVKPPQAEAADALPFNQSSWSNVGVSPTWAVRSVDRMNNQAGNDGGSSIQCLSADGGGSCINFGDEQTCKTYLTGDTTTYGGQATQGMHFGNQPYLQRADTIISSRM